jgi:CO dehydrogenase/acetyl-CoA synthase beta subunit
MAAFDGHFVRVAGCSEELQRSGRQTRRMTLPNGEADLRHGLPVNIGPGAQRGIILRGDTFVELGSPEAGSCGFALWTDNTSAVRDGCVTLIGPDIPEAPGGSLPFAQVLLVAGTQLGRDQHAAIGQAQYVADQIEGYMLRSSSRQLWARVSKDAVARGFCFETLGRALTAIFKSTLPAVQAMEIVFVTSAKEDLTALQKIADDVGEIGGEIVREQWKAKGYDLDCDLHCGSCGEKDVCEDIRKIAAAQIRTAKKGKPVRTAAANA